jgi:hypothetical protein
MSPIAEQARFLGQWFGLGSSLKPRSHQAPPNDAGGGALKRPLWRLLCEAPVGSARRLTKLGRSLSQNRYLTHSTLVGFEAIK